LLLSLLPGTLAAQAAAKFPPDSLVNTQVIPHRTDVIQVIGQMRNFTSALGVRCQFCHVGEEGQPLDQFDFIIDQKRTKLVARQMMRMVEEVNRGLDTLPPRPTAAVQATCTTCHHGVSRPITLAALMVEIGQAAGADSALRAYQALRDRYYGRDSYDFGESSLSIAAFRLGRAGRAEDALAILRYNERLFPSSSAMSVVHGNVLLMKGDTTAAEGAFREAIRRDSTNGEARVRLQNIGRKP
jgi:hypothetical protein